MKRVLFVTMHRPKRSPGQRFRFEQYIPYLEQNGYACDLSFIISEADDKVLYKPGRYGRKALIFAKSVLIRLGDVLAARRYDIVFIYREALMVNSGIIEALLARSGARLVFDFDDAIWLQGVSDANAGLAWLRAGPSKIPRVLRRMDLVLAGNQYLADYARQFTANVHVAPTTLDTDTHAPRPGRPHDGVCIGWSGSFSTTPYFDGLKPVLRRVKQRFGDAVYFKLIGDPSYRCRELGVEGVAWSEASEVEETAELDIGLMPLPDDPWTRGKCGFKALLYMSMAIPAVVSPVGVNADIVEDGVNGLVARDDDGWVDALSQLVSSPDLRAELGRRGRQTVVERYSLQSQKRRYLALFDALTRDAVAA
jgi:glycosyltransferase involved in cell wall biosynthesis